MERFGKVRILERDWKISLGLDFGEETIEFWRQETSILEILGLFGDFFLEECSMERSGKLRILERDWKISLGLDFDEETIDFGEGKWVFLKFWDFLGTFFRRMFDGTVWKIENSWKELKNFTWFGFWWENDRFQGWGIGILENLGLFGNLF